MRTSSVCGGSCGVFSDTVRYCSPSHGGWGIVRTAMLVPESYQLFVCPFACGRHGAIGAMVQGFKDRLSYLYIDEGDIVSGGYEELIPEAVDELLSRVKKRPKALFVVVSCLDDLLCTDHEAFLSVMRERHPDVHFAVGHMNPISLDGNVPPAVNIQRSMFSLLDRPNEPPLPDSMAFYGNNVSLDSDGELFQVLRAAGFNRFGHLSTCSDFRQFQELARASLNLVIAPVGKVAAEDVGQRLGIDSLFMPVSYDLDEIERGYVKLLSRYGATLDLAPFRAQAEEAVRRVRDLAGDLPVMVDASATIRPFCLAKLLYEAGFNLDTVYAQKCIPLDRPYMDWLLENAPKVKIVQPEHFRGAVHRGKDAPCLAVGFEGAYLSGASYVVNLMGDETLYGYHGVVKLMSMIAQALSAPADLKALLDDYGIVV